MSLRSAGRRGITLVEVIVTMAIMTVIVGGVVTFFRTSMTGFSSMEARTILGSVNQQALNRTLLRLKECKRVFEGDTVGNGFLARVVQGRPVELSGNVLPLIAEDGSLTPSSSTFVQASVGNRLFFAAVDAARDLPIPGGVVTVDTYRFHFYAPGPKNNGKVLEGKPVNTLWEWHSVLYADWAQLTTLTGSTQTAAIDGLIGQNINYAWDSSTGAASAAFYVLQSGTPLGPPSSTHQIPQETGKIEFKTMDMLNKVGGGFTYGLSPNTLAPPKFAAAGSVFPAGFEVIVIGPAIARQVVLRIVLAAKGGFKGNIFNEQVLVAAVRDVW